jgi:tetratricopeptide (TPR) repeat protein
MQSSRIVRLLCLAVSVLITEQGLAADEDAFLQQVRPPSEQAIGQGRSAAWTLPLVATQYQPAHPTPAMQAALQAQREGRFLDALIPLDEARKNGSADAELNLLRASLLLQDNQSGQALESLAPLLAQAPYAADAYALTAMAHLQQGKMPEALDTAQRAQGLGGGLLPHLALSYALQGAGRLAEARDVIHRFNAGTTPSAIALAREAELALTLGETQSARTLVNQAQQADAAQPYVVAVSGLVYLIDGHPRQAKAAFETALQRDPRDAKALLGLGLAEIRLGNFKAGQEKLQAANEADPGNALILTYLGRSQQQLGQTEAARASWRAAQQADPKDPIPWLYQAQAELQANRPLDARASLGEAQARLAYRSVYRGERLLMEDEQLLRANLAEVQRQMGSENLALHTLTDAPGEKNSASLRNQADLLQGQRFGESARRSLLLQSQFNAKPGTLPSELDIYGDGAGQTGAAVPQHGAVSALSSQQASYNNYDDLFSPHTVLAADATKGNQNTSGEQVRLGAGSDTLGVGLAQRQFKTDGNGPFQNLDNRLWQGIVQWQPTQSTEMFVSRQSLNSQHGETTYPADPMWNGQFHQINDNSGVTRLGLRQSLSDSSELRGLVSRQQTDQRDNWEFMANVLPFSTMPPFFGPTLPFPQGTFLVSSKSEGGELQYRRSGASYAAQWGMSSVRASIDSQFGTFTKVAQQLYADWQQALNPNWQLEAGLVWGKSYTYYNTNNTYLRRWLPRLGLVYSPDSATHVRLAAWKNLDNAAVGNASLAPATLAGIALNRPGDDLKLVRGAALGADKQLDAAWLLEGQAQRRWTDNPYNNAGTLGFLSDRVDESRLALHWQPGSVIVTLAYDYEFIQHDPGLQTLDSILNQHLRSEQLGLRWLASEHWTANLAWSRNWVSATQEATDLVLLTPILFNVKDRFNQVDAGLNWRFNRVGSVDFGVRNATNRAIPYTEIDPLVPRFSKGRLGYARLTLLW